MFPKKHANKHPMIDTQGGKCMMSFNEIIEEMIRHGLPVPEKGVQYQYPMQRAMQDMLNEEYISGE